MSAGVMFVIVVFHCLFFKITTITSLTNNPSGYLGSINDSSCIIENIIDIDPNQNQIKFICRALVSAKNNNQSAKK